MSVFNGQRYLAEAIESILYQTWTDFEFLIINDGSTDNSRDIILSFNDHRIRLIDRARRIGLTKSLNHGLQLSQGELVARQDADDKSYPRRLERQVKFLETHSQVVLVGTNARAIDEKGEPRNTDLRTPSGLPAIRWYLMFQNPFIHSTIMFRKKVILEKLGGYDESFSRAQDYELWSRTARDFTVENVPEILLDHRYEYGSIISQLYTLSPLEDNIVHKNLQVFLQDSEVSLEFAKIITRIRRKDTFDNQTDWKKIAEMVQKVCDRYFQLHPDAKFDRAIHSHIAATFYWIAYYSAPCNRRVSFRSYIKARELASKSNKHPSLIKYVTLWAVGESIRRVYKRLRYHLK